MSLLIEIFEIVLLLFFTVMDEIRILLYLSYGVEELLLDDMCPFEGVGEVVSAGCS